MQRMTKIKRTQQQRNIWVLFIEIQCFSHIFFCAALRCRKIKTIRSARVSKAWNCHCYWIKVEVCEERQFSKKLFLKNFRSIVSYTCISYELLSVAEWKEERNGNHHETSSTLRTLKSSPNSGKSEIFPFMNSFPRCCCHLEVNKIIVPRE
jgi:hypothetical protein